MVHPYLWGGTKTGFKSLNLQIMQQMNDMQAVKRRFFAMRNGMLADALRQGVAANFRIIFGLNIPQLNDIAAATGHNPELAAALWANTSTRESMLLAPMLMRPEDLTADSALAMARQAPTPEVADTLCHRLLRHMPDAPDIAECLCDSVDPMHRYVGLRLTMNLLTATTAAQAAARARTELARNTPLTTPVSHQILTEAEWLAESC